MASDKVAESFNLLSSVLFCDGCSLVSGDEMTPKSSCLLLNVQSHVSTPNLLVPNLPDPSSPLTSLLYYWPLLKNVYLASCIYFSFHYQGQLIGKTIESAWHYHLQLWQDFPLLPTVFQGSSWMWLSHSPCPFWLPSTYQADPSASQMRLPFPSYNKLLLAALDFVLASSMEPSL